MVIIVYLWYIQNGAPKLMLMAQPLKHPQSVSGGSEPTALEIASCERRHAVRALEDENDDDDDAWK